MEAATAARLLEGLETARKEVGRHVRAGDLPAGKGLQTLVAPLRGLLETPRMIVYRAETRPATALAPRPS